MHIEKYTFNTFHLTGAKRASLWAKYFLVQVLVQSNWCKILFNRLNDPKPIFM